MEQADSQHSLEPDVAPPSPPPERPRPSGAPWAAWAVIVAIVLGILGLRQLEPVLKPATSEDVVGLMNTLHLEGLKYDIRVNCLAPAAGTAMTDGLMTKKVFELLAPESVSHGVVFLASRDAPSRSVLCAGGGSFAVYKAFETEGVNLHPDKLDAEGVAAAWDAINDEKNMKALQSGFEQSSKFAIQGAAKLGIDLAT